MALGVKMQNPPRRHAPSWSDVARFRGGRFAPERLVVASPGNAAPATVVATSPLLHKKLTHLFFDCPFTSANFRHGKYKPATTNAVTR